MGFFRTAKKVIKPHVDVPKWIDYQSLRNTSTYLFENIKSLVTPKKSTLTETFEDAVQRFNLTETDIKNKQKQFYGMTLIYSLFGICVFGYFIYLFIYKNTSLAAFMSFSMSGVLFALAFRNRFWYFQTKTRRLGYSLKEWFVADILKKGPPHDLPSED